MNSILIVATLVKWLLIPTYHSTDFEVHRNWMAITHSLPFSEWYREATSQWTLDYPPFFAWFEKLLSVGAAVVDESMLQIQAAPFVNERTIIYQRCTVMASELILFWGLWRYINAEEDDTEDQKASTSSGTSSTTTPTSTAKTIRTIIAVSIFLHPGLWIVDHMHFQYNGLLYGLLVHSIVDAQRGRYLWCAALFATLLNFKHIYLYMAPAYFVYLLSAYCFVEAQKFSVVRLAATGTVVIAIFAVSLGPIVATGQLQALVARLFPFTRGLCHAYWAPNIWALYAGLDRCLIFVAKRLHWSFDASAVSSMTRGYVGDTVFAVLPTVDAIHTLVLTVLVQLIVLQVVWRKPSFDNFVSSLTLCGFASYLFGWHVHEKAIMIVLIPYSFMAGKSLLHLRIFTILSSAGIISLYPLLFHVQETPIKWMITLIWYLSILPGLSYCLHTKLRRMLSNVERLYLLGLVALVGYVGAGHTLIFGDRLEFLPLMVTSVYCAVGIVYSWLLMMYAHLTAA
ncbi:glycosyltransferase family 57 protein [Gongronella butleri]|nr:glycosyltransferase family 57 protein [Gongronella butleri]